MSRKHYRDINCVAQSLRDTTPYIAPRPDSTTRTVLSRITQSTHSDQLRTYQLSYVARASKLVWLRPLTCHRPVMPGLTYPPQVQPQIVPQPQAA